MPFMQPWSSLPYSQDTAPEPCPQSEEASFLLYSTFTIVTITLSYHVTADFSSVFLFRPRRSPDNKRWKVKCTPVQALRLCTGRTAHRGSRGIALPFYDHGTRRGEGSASRPGRSLPPGKTRYPLYMRLGGPQSRSGQVWKISTPPGFDPRTVQPVANRYTDWATGPTSPGNNCE